MFLLVPLVLGTTATILAAKEWADESFEWTQSAVDSIADIAKSLRGGKFGKSEDAELATRKGPRIAPQAKSGPGTSEP